MEQKYETTEIWYPYHGCREMIEIPYDPQKELSSRSEDSKLVVAVKE